MSVNPCKIAVFSRHDAHVPNAPMCPSRYYLSKSWAGNLRRYVEAQARRRRRSPSFASSSNSLITSASSGGKEKRSRGRERAESNLMPPWQGVNADIMCPHQGLAHSSQRTRGKVSVCVHACACDDAVGEKHLHRCIDEAGEKKSPLLLFSVDTAFVLRV